MSKFQSLVKILDQIRIEGAAAGFTSYLPEDSNIDATNQARAKAYIHLFLKVKFGLLDFKLRDTFVTDGTQDGGVDGYFIDRDAKAIHLIQSKFRTNERNFIAKEISLDEIVIMDVGRISAGEENDEKGITYNGKIQRLIRAIREIEDIGRYRYFVTIIANAPKAPPKLIKSLAGGFPVEVFDAERCFSELVFPVLSGTYFQQKNLSILLDLSNKNAGTKISYEATTEYGPTDVTVLFVPTLEIAKTMLRYKNAVLKHNPRSYLEFIGQAVNTSIRDTIVNNNFNEFALLNNGITMLSDETHLNEKIGQKNRAQLFVKNPQIINGGQTAYTLSRIYEENLDEASKIFSEKEVLLKVITLDAGSGSQSKNALIDRISTATNQQTAVTNSDRYSNSEDFELLQKTVFERYGILFERKRGEFADGIRDGYLTGDQVLDRNAFAKIYFAANDEYNLAVSRRAILKIQNPAEITRSLEKLDRFFFAYRAYQAFAKQSPNHHTPGLGGKNAGTIAKINLFTEIYFSSHIDDAEIVTRHTAEFLKKWDLLVSGGNTKRKFLGFYSKNRGAIKDAFEGKRQMSEIIALKNPM